MPEQCKWRVEQLCSCEIGKHIFAGFLCFFFLVECCFRFEILVWHCGGCAIPREWIRLEFSKIIGILFVSEERMHVSDLLGFEIETRML